MCFGSTEIKVTKTSRVLCFVKYLGLRVPDTVLEVWLLSLKSPGLVSSPQTCRHSPEASLHCWVSLVHL